MARNMKNVWYLYQGRRVNTQTNAGGGALRTRISVPAGQVCRVVSFYAQGTASAGSSLSIGVYDEDVALDARWINIAAGATREANLPQTVSGSGTSASTIDTSRGPILGPGQYVLVDSSVALQNETLTVGVVLLLSTPTEPTWDTTGSAGTPSLAASTISTANTLQAVVM